MPPYYTRMMNAKQTWIAPLLSVFLGTTIAAQEGAAPGGEAPRAPEIEAPPPPPARLDMVVKKGRTKKKTSSTGRQETYQFTLVVKNLEPVRELKDAEVNLYVLGQDVLDRNLYNLVFTHTAIVDLPPLKEAEIETDTFYLKYTGASGTEFGGYIVTVDDAEGNRQLVKTTNAKFEKQLDEIREQKVSKTKTYSFRID